MREIKKKIFKIFDEYFKNIEKNYDMDPNRIKVLRKKMKKNVEEFLL